MVTNQAGIGRGDYTQADFLAVNARMVQLLKKEGVRITSTFWCPHTAESLCACRKPKTRMFEQAKLKFNLELHKSFMIGDKESDRIPGLRSFIVRPNTPQVWPLTEL